MSSKYDNVLSENEYFIKLNKEDDYKKISYILRVTAARKGINISCTPGVFVCGLETYNVLYVKKTDKKPPIVGRPKKKKIGNLFEKTYKRIEKIKELKREGLEAKEIAESLGISLNAYVSFCRKYKKQIGENEKTRRKDCNTEKREKINNLIKQGFNACQIAGLFKLSKQRIYQIKKELESK